MKLTRKILLFIMLICLTFSSFYFLLFHLVLDHPIEEQKRERLDKIAAGALTIFEKETRRIKTLAEKWAMWDPMYNYTSQPTKAFEKKLSVPLMLRNADLSLLLVVDKEKKIILLHGYHNAKAQPIPFGFLKQRKGPLWRYLNQTFTMKNSDDGMVDCEYGPMTVVSSPILHGDNSGPPNGRLIIGRLIDPAFDKKIADATQLFFLLLIAGFIPFAAIIYFIINRLVVRRVKTISSKTENLRKDEIEHMLALNKKLIYLGKISSNIAHEINNPLFAIANSIEIIKKHLPTGDGDLNDIVKMVEREIRRVRTITCNMHRLTIREIEEPSLSDISEIINAAVNVTKWSKQLKHSVVNYKKKGRSFPLYCNPATLQQVFMNLLINAVEAMEGKGTLFIDVNEEGDDYIIDFTDTGPGIDETIKNTIFTPHKTTRYGKGSGLGLYISNNIILNHGGSITLDDNYNRGARFIIRLPQKGALTHERL